MKSKLKTMFYKRIWLIPALLMLMHCQRLQAGNHHVESADHRCVGCIDGTCGTPTGPFGHYRGTWRRFPGSMDTRFDHLDGTRGNSGQEPVIPEPVEEMNASPRSRSDRPLKPEEMIDRALAPATPLEGGAGNPFNSTVEDTDLPTPSGGGGNDGFGMFDPPPVDTDEGGGNDPIPPFQNDAMDPPDAGFGVPGGDSDITPDPVDLFNSNLFEPFNSQEGPVPGRNIKARGMSMLKRVDIDHLAMLPEPVMGPPVAANEVDPLQDLLVDANIELASFQQSVGEQFESGPPPMIAQIAEDLAPASVVPNPLRRSMSLRRLSGSIASSYGTVADLTSISNSTNNMSTGQRSMDSSLSPPLSQARADAPARLASSASTPKALPRSVKSRPNPLRR